MAPRDVKILAVGCYVFGQSNLGETSGLIGRVFKGELFGVIFYTRETAGGVDSFYIGSGERWGDKSGKKPSKSRQALELWAPPYYWEQIAAAVKEIDALHRPVRKNKNFTPVWAKNHLHEI